MARPVVSCAACGHGNRAAARYCGQCGGVLGAGEALPGWGRLAGPGPPIGGRYRLEQQLGSGSFGRALLADDIVLDRRCVVKQLRLDTVSAELYPQVTAAFEREARLLVRLNTPGHPNIPEIYEYLPAEHCLVMKYITGTSLQLVLKGQLGPLPEETALRYARDVCSALAYMHGREPAPVIHGDLKPANILLDSEGRIWLVDFGLSRPHRPPADGGSGEARERPSGTPGYTPPEQWRGQVEPRSDIYALGATLFELLTRQRPLSDAGELVLALRRVNPLIATETERLIRRALALDVARRPDAAEMLASLEHLLAKVTLPPPPPAELPPAGGPFLGREGELRTLQGRLRAERAVALIGMAGVGKTALLSELLQRAAPPEARFFHACMADAGLDRLLYQLCAHLARQGEPGPWEHLQRARLRDDRAHLARTLADMVLAALPRGAAGPDPLLCLDDAHVLAGDPTAALLLAGLRRLARGGLLRLLVASREALPPFVEAELLRLGGLEQGEAAMLVASHGVSLDPALLGELHRATGGNAQLLILASNLLAGRPDAQAAIAGLVSAPDVERYLIAEVDEGLSREERQVMQAVAALAVTGATRDLVEYMAGGAVKRALRSLSDRQLLLRRSDEGGAYVQHALVRAFYSELPARAERIRLHRSAAGYFQEVAPDSLGAAYHLLHAGDAASAAELAVAASLDALHRGRLAQLRAVLEQIPAEHMDHERAVELLLARAEAQIFAGAGGEARASLMAALARLQGAEDRPSSPALTARACRGLAGALEHEAPGEALAWVERGLAALGGADPVEEALLLHRQGSLHLALGAFDAAEGVLERALAGLPEAMPDRRADVLVNLGISFCARGLREPGVARLHEALELYRRTGNSWGEGTAYQNLGIDSDYAGDWEGAGAAYGRALACAEATGNVERQAHLALLLGTLATQRGDDAVAEERLGRCVALAGEHQLREYQAMALSSLGDLQIARGELDAAAGTLARAEELAASLGEGFHQLPEIYRGQALTVVERDAGRAEAKARRALDLAREQGEPREEGRGLRVLAQVLAAGGRLDEAAPLFGQAVALLDEYDPYEAARARGAWARALAEREPERAAALRGEARATFARLGARRDLAALDEAAPAAPASGT